jgi:hypothetical protein
MIVQKEAFMTDPELIVKPKWIRCSMAVKVNCTYSVECRFSRGNGDGAHWRRKVAPELIRFQIL